MEMNIFFSLCRSGSFPASVCLYRLGEKAGSRLSQDQIWVENQRSYDRSSTSFNWDLLLLLFNFLVKDKTVKSWLAVHGKQILILLWIRITDEDWRPTDTDYLQD